MIRHLLRTLGLAAVVAVPVHAQQDSAAVAKSINDLEVQWGVSIDAGNWDAVATFLAPEYMATNGAGKRMDRAGYLASLKDAGTSSNSSNGPYTVVVHGSTAIHLGEATYTLTKNGKATRYHLVWTDTWIVMPNGQWLCIASQGVEQKLK